MTGEPYTGLILRCPLPPSQNAKNIVVKFGKRASIGKSPEYKAYQKRFREQIWPGVRQLGRFDFSGSLLAWTITFPPRHGCDTDNYHKVLFDCLQDACAIENDNQIVGSRNERGYRVKDGMIDLYLCQEKHRADMARCYEVDLLNVLPRRLSSIAHAPESWPRLALHSFLTPGLTAAAE